MSISCKLSEKQIKDALDFMNGHVEKDRWLFENLAAILQYEPEPVDGDLTERVAEAIFMATRETAWDSRTFKSLPYWLKECFRKRAEVAARVCLEEALKSMQPEEFRTFWMPGTGLRDSVQKFLHERRRRLLHPKPKDRVGLKEFYHIGHTFPHRVDVLLDGICVYTATSKQDAEIYADGLRYRLEKSEKETPTR